MKDTIAAISTAYGEGGIGIVRINGEDALKVLNTIFVPKTKIMERKMTYGHKIGRAHV